MSYLSRMKSIRFIAKTSTFIIPYRPFRKKLQSYIYNVLCSLYNQTFTQYYRSKYPSSHLLYTDLALSVGGACKCAHYLQNFSLRKFSSPIDWMMNYTLKDITEMFENNFSTFFTEITEEPRNNVGGGGKHHLVKDKHNGMTSIHDFPINQSLLEYQPIFLAKMTKRFETLKKSIKSSKNILFLSARTESLEACQSFLESMYQYHHANYTLLNIRHTPQSTQTQRKVISFSKELTLVEYLFNDSLEEGGQWWWLGNTQEWNHIMPLIVLCS